MGHGFRKDLASMLANLKPQFLKFPGNYLRNAFRWSETVGPWGEGLATLMMPGDTGLMTDLDSLSFFSWLKTLVLPQRTYIFSSVN